MERHRMLRHPPLPLLLVALLLLGMIPLGSSAFAATLAIAGVVTDRETGVPIPGADIWSPAGPTSTDTDGSYEIYDLDPGDHWVSAGGVRGYQDRIVAPVTYDGVTTVHLDIELIPLTVAPDVLGTVTDAATGDPLIGAQVSLFWEDGGTRIPSVETDVDGVYGVRGVDVGRAFRLRVAAPWQMIDFPGWDAAAYVSEVQSFDGGEPLVIDLQIPPRPSFSDVLSDHVHAWGIFAIAEAGITLGFPDGTFRPAGNVTRGQMASFLARALDLPPSDDITFSDVPPTSTHAPGISAIAAAGITLGFPDGTFRPAGNVTRGQMASFLARGLDLIPLAPFDACLVTYGDVLDAGFNQTAYAGLLRARNEHELNVAVIASSSDATIARNIQTFMAQGCGIIVTVGFVMGEATEAAAEANPTQPFAIVDVTYDDDHPNLRELTFAADQAAFLAGYVAAAMTESGSIGTFGGLQIRPVTVFMDGYLAGARFYNAEHDADVTVQGWDGESGLFTDDFTSPGLGQQLATTLLQAGADIILPVAGPAGAGTGAAIEAHGSGAMMWVDTDGYDALPQYRALLLTSVLKRIDNVVFDTIVDALIDGTFTGGTYEGTLENDGVGIAPFHEFEDTVPQDVKDRIPELVEGIIAGDISVDPADY
jgi:basic membrane protein A and related proteins